MNPSGARRSPETPETPALSNPSRPHRATGLPARLLSAIVPSCAPRPPTGQEAPPTQGRIALADPIVAWLIVTTARARARLYIELLVLADHRKGPGYPTAGTVRELSDQGARRRVRATIVMYECRELAERVGAALCRAGICDGVPAQGVGLAATHRRSFAHLGGCARARLLRDRRPLEVMAAAGKCALRSGGRDHYRDAHPDKPL